MKLGDCCSSCLDIACGVPQGSVTKTKVVLFADDTNIFCSGDDLHQLQEEITSEMSKLNIWFNSNKLSLNLSKTKIMLFGNCRLNTLVKIQIDGVNSERVNENTFRGVTIDEKLIITT